MQSDMREQTLFEVPINRSNGDDLDRAHHRRRELAKAGTDFFKIDSDYVPVFPSRKYNDVASAMEIGESNGTLSILGVNAQETYILCGSHLETPLCDLDDGYGQLRILDTVAFANAISRQIPGFGAGIEGSCIYRSNSLIRKKGNRPISPPTEGQNVEKWFKEQNEYVGSQIIDSLFLKDVTFKEELEYRLVWFAEGEKRPLIDMKYLAAKELCEAVNESS